MQHLVNIVGLLSVMTGGLIVAVPQNVPRQSVELARWSESTSAARSQRPPTVELGRRVIGRNGCLQCHSLEGHRGVGPALNDLAGKTVIFNTGQIRLADDAYLRQSIEDPTARIVNGFTPAMPSYRGRLNEREIASVVLYLRSISRHVSAEPIPPATAPSPTPPGVSVTPATPARSPAR